MSIGSNIQNVLRRTRSVFTDDPDNWINYYLERVHKNDPEAAVGPPERFDEIGTWQLGFLISEGLRPDDRLLDIGCGCCRAGQYLADYLFDGEYIGMDIDGNLLESGASRLRNQGVENQVKLIQNEDLRFDEICEPVNFAWANSVFTHSSPDLVAQCLQNIQEILTADGQFFASLFIDSSGPYRAHQTNWYYSRGWVIDQATTIGLEVEWLDNRDHPSGQKLVRIT